MALINIAGKSYELVLENKAGFNVEAFRNRYSEVLERYDYIVGDWGYNQLRLKGFFKDGSNKATKDTTFAFATDYLNEYCNFGCAYFILEKKFDQNEQQQDEIDPLLADLDEDYDYVQSYNNQADKNLEHSDKQDQEDSKTVKVLNTSPKQQQEKQQQGQVKGNDKPSKRRQFKHRQNKNNANSTNNSNQNNNNNSNVTNQADQEKDIVPNKKNKRRSNKPFRHFDRKKNKEHVTTVQK